MTNTKTENPDFVFEWLSKQIDVNPEATVCPLPAWLIYEVLGVTTDKGGVPVSRNGEPLCSKSAAELVMLSSKVGYIRKNRTFCFLRSEDSEYDRKVSRSLAPLLREVAIAIGKAAGYRQKYEADVF